jgi:hypothetical protein
MFQRSCYPLSCHARQVRWGILGLCSAPLLGAYFYSRGFKISFLICPLRHLTGIPCPTCGMTRSFMAIVRGDWLQALAAHLFGPVLFASFLIAIVHIASELLTGRRITAFYIQLLRRRALQVNILFIVLSYYALRLYYLSMSGELTLAFLNSPFGHLLFSGTNAS